jgi:hypothetical protein
MNRARRAGLGIAAVIVALAVVTMDRSGEGLTPADLQPANAVAWPQSTLLVAEVVTGGTSASDEYVELFNSGPAPVDLIGLEVVYVTSSGATVTRKATWSSSQPLASGQHLLIANALGAYAGLADATYSGGLAATGGSLALRIIGGSVVDALGWGDAANAFVEGLPAVAPASGSSLERRPGGIAGNGDDSNDNATDWFIQPAPVPQNLAAAPTPQPTASPSPIPTLEPTPAPTATPEPTATATPMPTPAPTATPEPTATATPTSTPTSTATPTPSPSPTATPTPEPSPTPTSPPTPIELARSLVDGSAVTVEGVLTTDLGALEDGRSAFVQDETAGIGIYLDSPPIELVPAGTIVRVNGTISDRYAQRTVRAAPEQIVAIGTADLPAPIVSSTGSVGEVLEGSRALVTGVVVEAPTLLADGTALTVDDGSGAIRVIVAPAALGSLMIDRDATIVAVGPVGQRDSSGTGLAGYRLLATLPGELAVVPISPPSPTPSPSPTPAPTSSLPPSPLPSAAPTPTPSPTPSGQPTAIADVRSLPIGTRVRTLGAVTAEAGRLGSPPLLSIQDATAGIVVRLPDGTGPIARGSLVDVTGILSAPYGQLEIRPSTGGVSVLGPGVLPAPAQVTARDLGESTEASLVSVDGLVDQPVQRSTSGDLKVSVLDTTTGGRITILSDASSHIVSGDIPRGSRLHLTGVAGQRASRRGALDGYRVWLRDRADIVVTVPAPAPTSGPSGNGGRPAVVPIARALLQADQVVHVVGTVTAGGASLGDAARLFIIQDSSAAIEVRLPADGRAPRVGRRLDVVGKVGRAYGAPRLNATATRDVGAGSPVLPLVLRGAPGPAHEWRLVRMDGAVLEVHRTGERWRAEVLVGRDRVVSVGTPGSGVPVSAIVEGHRVTIVGIVKRPYPTASDRRFTIDPRTRSDVRSGGPAPAGGSGTAGPASVSAGAGPGTRSPGGPLDLDLADLADHLGALVRVGGSVESIDDAGFVLDDGTGLVQVLLLDEAASYLSVLAPGDVLNAIGVVGGTAADPDLRVSDPAGIVRVDDLGASMRQAAVDGTPATEQLAQSSTRAEGLGGLLGQGGPAGLGTVLALSIASAAVTIARRRRSRRALAARIAARLGAIRGPRPGGDPGREGG